MISLARQSASLRLILVTPAVAIFVSSMLVNVGNLGFNMIFSRLMGPELFGSLAFLLTLKLSALSLFGAAQMAVSHLVSARPVTERSSLLAALARLDTGLFAILAAVCLPAGIVLWTVLGPASLSPILLLAAMPFGASLSLLRGVSYGSLNTGRIILSANLEMAVRLIFAIAAWKVGLGLPGVIGAITLSIIVGWLVLLAEVPRRRASPAEPGLLFAIGLGAAPFALLQIAQVFVLDGDIFIARWTLSTQEGGFIASLSLFQRIQFFACLSLATVLLPDLTRAKREGQALGAALAPVAVIFTAVSIAVVSACTLAPERMISLLVGSGYAEAAQHLPFAAFSAIAFTFSYLTATALVALGDKRGIWLCVGIAVLQLAAMAVTPDPSLASYVGIKLGCQLLAAIVSAVLIARTALRK
ncbi:hypothetical protein ACSBLW_11440 [Thioclava sp. FR2]|uniref:hypothetical protein n=1 Tax=Thioclava sp. FR2 TaxID=3445780 RepID=UPI003EBB066A